MPYGLPTLEINPESNVKVGARIASGLHDLSGLTSTRVAKLRAGYGLCEAPHQGPFAAGIVTAPAVHGVAEEPLRERRRLRGHPADTGPNCRRRGVRPNCIPLEHQRFSRYHCPDGPIRRSEPCRRATPSEYQFRLSAEWLYAAQLSSWPEPCPKRRLATSCSARVAPPSIFPSSLPRLHSRRLGPCSAPSA